MFIESIKKYAVPSLIISYMAFFVYWAWIYTTGEQEGFHNYFWNVFPQGVLPVSGGIYGIFLARQWGLLSSAFGRAMVFISASSVLFGIASLIWAYLNFFQEVEVPYPSITDLFYALQVLTLIVGAISLGQGVGAGYRLRTPRGKLILFLAPVLGVLLTYVVFVLIAQGGDFGLEDATPLQIFINMYYLLSDVLIVTVIGLIYGLSYSVLGGKFKRPINLMLIGGIVIYIGDALFTYREAQEIYYNADVSDLLFAASAFLFMVAVASLDIKGISSRVRSELAMFAPRTNEAINNLVLGIVNEQVRVIGPVAWEEAMKVPGITVDVKNNTLSVSGDPKAALQGLVSGYEGLFGKASLEICRNAARKFITQVPPERIPEVLR